MDVQIRALEKAQGMGYKPLEDGCDYPPVKTTQIFDPSGDPIGGWQRVMNMVDGGTIAIHTDRYALTPYEESFAALEAAIRESTLDQRALMVKTEFTHNGGRCFRSYLFPMIGIDVGEDPISMQILAFDSYDGTYSRSIACGGYRYICLNGNFFGRTVRQMKVKHTKGSALRYENALETLMDTAATFTMMQPRLLRWRDVSLDVRSFEDLVSHMPQMTQRLSDALVALYATTAEEHTLYGAWNTMTSWATNERGNAQSRVDRDRRVAALIETKPWRTMEG